MLSRILKLHPSFDSKCIENLLWPFLNFEEKLPPHRDDHRPELRAFENFLDQSRVPLTANTIVQTELNFQNLKSEKLIAILHSGITVQCWFDRSITAEEAMLVNDLGKKYKNLELIYLPDQHFVPEEVFSAFCGSPPLFLHLKLKEHDFDRWPKPEEILRTIEWLKTCSKISFRSPQVFATQILSANSIEETSFLKDPSSETLRAWVTSQNGSQNQLWRKKAESSVRSREDFGRFFRLWILALYTIGRQTALYPVKKFYWMLEHFIKKHQSKKA